jgi:DNA-binding transcriptional MerR regulator
MEHPLPDKLYYKIGEISKSLSLNPSVLRFWETEFSQLNPRKSSTGQRLYSKNDLDLLVTIRKLLHKDKLTIEGARRVISGMSAPTPVPKEFGESSEEIKSLLFNVREELRFCMQILNS